MTIIPRVEYLSTDIKLSLVKRASDYSFALDESTDATDTAQLAVPARIGKLAL